MHLRKQDNIALCESAWSDLWPAAAASLGWWRLINTEAAAFETSQVLIRERENLVFHPGQIKWQSSPSGDVTKYSGWCNKLVQLKLWSDEMWNGQNSFRNESNIWMWLSLQCPYIILLFTIYPVFPVNNNVCTHF